ncbi:putative acyl-CoA synthetase; AMP-dependent synthetase and ligase [Cupriavidus taiwanensis]|uniref:Acyl-CoA synthetase AMP-dependent synthetase and ligase n=1 Tax=Cupriavidus taiwanensis TaxID=164546 RepID=A0A375EAJ0_9BURK|nr:long-chain fatty acid--CoA ligase [Cupriavidus taiwanensis]SOZ66307.1 putative acyl-CoA synthetase; AMP-dependent synthetase and ligase [Cupriavidus taiwanensis]SOZ67156.1 putative acyl-CoA synthetase; AMP-dependent synthetase and ligase [Cupriavidus taiwanensis]SOZ70688.1 putative acyl-CoA synthetase; AMP-dependent synthetase and ligase [Cupriavidus taiwanensis]SPA08840.1 putative acyl-CoA synthetase; AMP-dependent synthetase and ligase [Cupriavidus taiwanensis]
MGFAYFLRRAARYWGDQPAILYQDQVVTYRQLDERSTRLANALLALGLRPGDRVAVQSRNRPELVELECALYKAGLVKAALNPRFTAAEASDVVENCTPRVLIAGPGYTGYDRTTAGFGSIETFIAIGAAPAGYVEYEALLANAGTTTPDITPAADDLAVLHFSSGSTGKIKAAMQSYGNRMAALRKVVSGMDRPARPGDRLALIGPVTHASGMLMQPYLYVGATLVLFEKFEPAHFLAEVARLRITHVFMVPAMINMLLAEPTLAQADLSSLKTLAYGAAPMAPARIREAWERIGPILSQGYGASESTSGVTRLSTSDHADAIANHPERLASCGRALGETEVRVVDEHGREVGVGEIGELVIRGDDVFHGYWNEPGLTSETLVDGWLHTGDMARVDEAGYLYLVDRKKDMIISGGFNVYPTEVEATLYQHPDVLEACVISVPDDTWGESVKAVVTLRPGREATAQQLIAHCRERIADYKSPRSVDFVAELPKNASGKLARKIVRERYWQGVGRRVN